MSQRSAEKAILLAFLYAVTNVSQSNCVVKGDGKSGMFRRGIHAFRLFLAVTSFFVQGLVLQTWTVVPPSTNPNSRLNEELLKTLEAKTGLKCQRVDRGRIWLEVADPSVLTTINARSVRLVVLERSVHTENLSTDTILASLCQGEGLKGHMDKAIRTWVEMGNAISCKEQGNKTFFIQCTRWDGFVDPRQSTTLLVNAMSTKLADTFGWKRVKKSKDPTFSLHLLLYDSSVALEMVVLARPMVIDELPKPGFKRVESFVVGKAASIEANHIVLDPMCGRGTFLVEAATFWPDAKYFGVDASPEQLGDAALNCQAAMVKVDLRIGNASQLAQFPDSSVDRILSCPPFGRQFDKSSSELYADLLLEWSRVIKPDGKMVLLIDSGNLLELKEAITTAGCQVVFQRSEFWLGKIRATILVVHKGDAQPNDNLVQSTPFDWEVGELRGRALWTSLRSQALPKLMPVRLK